MDISFLAIILLFVIIVLMLGVLLGVVIAIYKLFRNIIKSVWEFFNVF